MSYDVALSNATFLDLLGSKDYEKRASEAVDAYTREKVREDGIFDRVLPAKQLANDQLHPMVDDERPMRVCEKEIDNPPAISLPFNDTPPTYYLRARRFQVFFDRIVSHQYTVDVDMVLRTTTMDLRQVIADNTIKDMLAEKDRKFISGINTMLLGQDAVVPTSGIAQWVSIPGGISRETTQDAFKIMPSTPSHLEVNTVLLNNVTMREVFKWRRDEMGGDYAQDIVKNGFSVSEFWNMKLITTIKRDLVPDDTFLMFADERFLGKHFTLEDNTMFMKKEYYLLRWFLYSLSGASWSNTWAVTRADFI